MIASATEKSPKSTRGPKLEALSVGTQGIQQMPMNNHQLAFGIVEAN